MRVKRILITGASSGLGAAMALRLSKSDCQLILTGRDRERLKKVCEQAGEGATYFPCDLSSFQEMDSLLAYLGEVELDVLINNAGIASKNSFEETSDEDWQRQWEVNMMAPVRLTRSLFSNLKKGASSASSPLLSSAVSGSFSGEPRPSSGAPSSMLQSSSGAPSSMLPSSSGAPSSMLPSSSGALPSSVLQSSSLVLHISSTAALRPVVGLSAYSSVKAAMVMWTKSLAQEWGCHGIRVNCICPGIVNTPIQSFHGLPEDQLEEIHRRHPIGRMGCPDDIAGMVQYLVDANWITGSIMTIDGGLSLG